MKKLTAWCFLGLASIALSLQTSAQAEVCDDIIDILGLGDTTVVVCPVPRVVVLQMVPGDVDTLIVTEDGDTLSWPLDTGQLPPEESWIPHLAMGLAPGADYLWTWNGLPFSWIRSSEAGTVNAQGPRGGSFRFQKITAVLS